MQRRQENGDLTKMRRVLPGWVKSFARGAENLASNSLYRLRYGFDPPPQGTDLVGYEALIRCVESYGLLDVYGDLVEIGAFCGGGSYKLAQFLKQQKSTKKLYVIDCFDISVDTTRCTAGFKMADLYARALNGRSQVEVFNEVTRGLSNIVVIAADSRKLNLPTEAICFAFVDGNHSSEYVRNDFHLIWSRLSGGGIVAFHDYDFDLPRVTVALNQLCREHHSTIASLGVDDDKHILFIQKN